jgi:hypothetical protein
VRIFPSILDGILTRAFSPVCGKHLSVLKEDSTLNEKVTLTSPQPKPGPSFMKTPSTSTKFTTSKSDPEDELQPIDIPGKEIAAFKRVAWKQAMEEPTSSDHFVSLGPEDEENWQR